jgi:hypothetical protein
MSAQPGNSPQYLSPPEEVYKDSYDNLIDEYATPYSVNAHHQTYTVQPLSTEHLSGFSHPHKQSYSSQYTAKHSDESASRAYPPSPHTKDTDTRGFWQKILPESLACRLYVITVLIQTTVDLAIEGDLLFRFHQSGPTGDIDNARKMPVYLSVFALAHVFQLIMAVDAVYARNTLQFICLTIFNALFLVYAIIQIFEIREIIAETSALTSDGVSHIPIGILTAILPIFISVAEVAYIALGWKIYHEFGWKVYKFLGADRRIKKMFTSYQIFQCLVKFDVFFWVGFSVQFIWLVLLQKSDWEYYITCAALPVSLILLVEGHLAARHENNWMMFTFMSGCVGALVYFIYKLVKVIKFSNTPQFAYIHKSLITFSVIAIALLVVTFIFAIIVMRNFGRGLKQSFDKNRNAPPQKAHSSSEPHRRATSKTFNRMSID